MKIVIDQERLTGELGALAAISSGPQPGVTRVVFTGADLEARRFVKELCSGAGLQIREDAVGNTFARWVGSEPELPAVGTGSHIDAIPHSGQFDGTVGVLGGVEAIRSLQRAGITPRRSIELILFTSEEPTRFGIGCLGSRLLSGTLPPSCGTTLIDADGRTLDNIREQAGFNGDLATVAMPESYYSSFVELHIEQGPILEKEQIDLGIVTSIAAPASLRIELRGEGGHAGAVLMQGRRDAFLAAAEIALAVESAATSTGAVDTVGTTGICDIFPRAVNSIPSQALMEIDVRDTDGARRDMVLAKITQNAKSIAARRQVAIETKLLNADMPAHSDPAIISVIDQACRTHTATHRHIISRAYHDSLFMARIVPMAMLFIPSRSGLSHRPDEYSSPQAIAQGVLVLAEALTNLAR